MTKTKLRMIASNKCMRTQTADDANGSDALPIGYQVRSAVTVFHLTGLNPDGPTPETCTITSPSFAQTKCGEVGVSVK